jgi:pimeloyl-ACP methyl ester carboxylesterase
MTSQVRLACFVLLLMSTGFGRPLAIMAGPIGPIVDGYGAPGSYSTHVVTIPSPLFLGRNVSVYLPDGAAGPVPTVFFAHGYDGNLPIYYDGILNHIASRGYAAVFSPYTSLGNNQSLRYAQMFGGFQAAVDSLPTQLDSTRVGFVGHSLGGGAVPALAWRGLVEEGWGANGAFLMPMAPWYSYDLSQSQLQSFPANTKLVMQIYDADRINDHRMAIDIFSNINIPAAEKDFVTLFSDSNGGTTQNTDHFVPLGATGSASVDGLDFYGIYRLLDALADYSFTGNLDGKNVALGGGSAAQTFMGMWSDGTPVVPLAATDLPATTYAQSEFLFAFENAANPRALLVPEPSAIALLFVGTATILLAGLAGCGVKRRKGRRESI